MKRPKGLTDAEWDKLRQEGQLARLTTKQTTKDKRNGTLTIVLNVWLPTYRRI